MPLLVVVDDAGVVDDVRAEIAGAGWTLSDGPGAVRTLPVRDAADARQAVLRAVGGEHLLVLAAGAPRPVVDDLVEDLGHIATVVYADAGTTHPLDAETWALVHALAGGATLATAARALHLSTRTANRRIGEARDALGAPTRAGLIAALRARGRIPAAP